MSNVTLASDDRSVLVSYENRVSMLLLVLLVLRRLTTLDCIVTKPVLAASTRRSQYRLHLATQLPTQRECFIRRSSKHLWRGPRSPGPARSHRSVTCEIVVHYFTNTSIFTQRAIYTCGTVILPPSFTTSDRRPSWKDASRPLRGTVALTRICSLLERTTVPYTYGLRSRTWN